MPYPEEIKAAAAAFKPQPGTKFSKDELTRAQFFDRDGNRIAAPPEALAPDSDSGEVDAEHLVHLSQNVQPEDWPKGHPGYNHDPFLGCKKAGWFLEMEVEEQSKDPAIQELNQQLWDACDDADLEAVVAALKDGAEVLAGDPADGHMWSAIIHLTAGAKQAAGLPDPECEDTADENEAKRIDVLGCLLDHGARVHCADIYGDTPLHYAAVRGYPKLTQRLLDAGALYWWENQYGSTPQRNAEINQNENPGCLAAADVIANAGSYDCGYPERGSIPQRMIVPRRADDYIDATGKVPPVRMMYPSHHPKYGLLDKTQAPLDDKAAKQRIVRRLERDAITDTMKDIHGGED